MANNSSNNASYLKILQWNSRSAVANKQSLLQFLLNNEIDIALISETCYKPEHNPKLGGFNVIRHDRLNRRFGGVAILLAPQLSNYRSLDLANVVKDLPFELCGVKVKIDNRNLFIFSLYNPPKTKISASNWEKAFRACLAFKGDVIFGGDFNAHHALWGSSSNDNFGNQIVEALNNVNFILLNDGSATRITPPGSPKSAVDLTLTTPAIAAISHWQVLNRSLGSDHKPILMEIKMKIEKKVIYPVRKWALDRANWTLFQALLDSTLENVPYVAEPEVLCNIFTNALYKSCEAAIPKNGPFTPKHRKRAAWWDDECDAFQKCKLEALNSYKTNASLENFLAFKKAEAAAKRLYKQKARKSWENFCSGLNANTSVKQIWKTARTLNNGKNSIPDIPLNVGEGILAKLTPCVANNKAPMIKCSNTQHFLLKPFTFQELDAAINTGKNTAPGLDNISYSMLRNMGPQAKAFLLNIFNLILSKGIIPKHFNDSVIILLLKPGKNPDSIDSYRPITLLSCIFKTFERLLKLRLEIWLKNSSSLPATQYGYKSGYGTIDATTHLTSDIQIGFSNNQTTGTLFVDIQSAYDNINLDILYDKLTALHLPTEIAFLLSNLYRERSVSVRLGQKFIGPRRTSVGIPQGAVLSPIIFNLYTADVHELWSPHIKSIQYADDLVIYSQRPSYSQCIMDLKHIMYSLEYWMSFNGFTIAHNKCAVMLFSRKRSQPLNSVTLHGHSISVTSIHKYLGVVFDRKLLWTHHINHILNRCEKGLNFLKLICKRSWGADQKTALLFYRAYIRSILDYGSLVYGSASNTNLKKIDKIQMKALKTALGVMKSTPNECTLILAAEPPLEYRRNFLACKYVIKQHYRQNHLNSLISSLTIFNLTSQYFAKKNSPPLAEAFLTCHDQNLLLTADSFTTDNLDYPLLLSSVKVIFPQYNDHLANITLLSVLNEYPEYCVIYTDGSKTDTYTSCAYYIPRFNIKETFQLNNNMSIFTAEACAIFQALKWCLDNEIKQIVLCTDSMSALKSIESMKSRSNTNVFITNLKKTLVILGNKNAEVKLVWSKAHSGIQHNERVDFIAKNFSDYNCHQISSVNPSDFFVCIKDFYNQKWNSRWYDYGLKTNTHLYQLQHSVNIKPFFNTLTRARNLVATILRLKTNHGRFPSHLHKIGILQDPVCTCGELLCDINHILFNCQAHFAISTLLMQELREEGIADPMRLPQLLAEDNFQIYKIIFRFLNRINQII